MNKIITSFMFVLILSMALLSLTKIDKVAAAGTIVINPDGSIEPLNAPIQRVGETYTLTSNTQDSIVINRTNIIFDGAQKTLNGLDKTTKGIYLNNVENVIIKNVILTNYQKGITLEHSASITIIDCHVTNNGYWGIGLYQQSDYINITGNYIADNNLSGIDIYNNSNHNTIHNNTIESNQWAGIAIYGSSNNMISENNIKNNKDEGILISDFISRDNTLFKNKIETNSIGIELRNVGGNLIYGNEFISNTLQVKLTYDPNALEHQRVNNWDQSYLTGGNYWSDYEGTDTNNDGIGDSPYYIDSANQDRFPLVFTTTPEPIDSTPELPEVPTDSTPEQPEVPTDSTPEQPEVPTDSTPEQPEVPTDSKGSSIDFMLIGFLVAGVVLAIIILYLIKNHRQTQ